MSSIDADAIRTAVEHTYATATNSNSTRATALAGYTEAQLGAVPDGVTASFFGCGNPLSLARVRPGDTVLDLGSGAGLDLILAGQAVGPSGRVIGVDMTSVMIARARSNVARAGLTNVEIREGQIERLPVDATSVDWVISNCVISLSPEKERVFAEVARVLKPGGEMLISDIVVDRRLAWVLGRIVRLAPSIAMAKTEAHYLAAIRSAGMIGDVVDRLIYEPGDLVGMFGDEVTREASSTCPIDGVRAKIARGAVGRAAIHGAAIVTAGHVWSAKLHARKPS
jgi:SAM-dependent methyltransferase